MKINKTQEEITQICKSIRRNILTMTTKAGAGHVTSSLSAVEIMAVLLFGGFFEHPDYESFKDLDNLELNKKLNEIGCDRFIFSKGHASPLFYALYRELGVLSDIDLQGFRKFDSSLEGHPTPRFAWTEATTGSLGQGLGIGIGLALGLGKKFGKSEKGEKIETQNEIKSGEILEFGQKDESVKDFELNKVFVIWNSQTGLFSHKYNLENWENYLTWLTFENQKDIENQLKITQNDFEIFQLGQNIREWTNYCNFEFEINLLVLKSEIKNLVWQTKSKITLELEKNTDKNKQQIDSEILTRSLNKIGEITKLKNNLEIKKEIENQEKQNNLENENIKNQNNQQIPNVFVLLGDSEMAEGSIWEALNSASFWQIGNLIAIVDLNRLGQTGQTQIGWQSEVLKKKLESFGSLVWEIDGHNPVDLARIYQEILNCQEQKPKVIIAKTLKGKGVSFLENAENWHGKALDKNQLELALAEI